MCAHYARILAHQRGRPLRDPGVREPVEAEAPDRPPLPPAAWQRVRARRRLEGGVKGCVEAGDGGNIRERLAHGVERREGLGLVKRREVAELAQRRADLGIDADRLTEALAAVDDAMADGLGAAQLTRQRVAKLVVSNK